MQVENNMYLYQRYKRINEFTMWLFKKKSMELTPQNIYNRLRPFLKKGLPKELAPFLFNENGEIRVFKYKGSFINELKQAGITFVENEIYEQYRHTTKILYGALFYLRNYKVNHGIKRLYPNLELLFSDYVNEESSEFNTLNGIVRPVDDPFWLTYYPPNYIDDNSRVTLTNRPVTNITVSELPPVEPDFQFARALKGLAKSGRYHESELKVSTRKQEEKSMHTMEPMVIDLKNILDEAIEEVYGKENK